MGAYKHILGLYPDLSERAERFNYPESSVCILKGNELELRRNFPETYNNLLSCFHNRDKRTPFEYGQDLVASWVFEDILMKSLADSGLGISGAGADKEREVLPHTKVSSSSDWIVSCRGKERPLELMCDYAGYWAMNGRVELRDDKFRKMQTSSSLFLGISTVDNRYILLDMRDRLEFTYIPSYSPYGGKPAYSIKLPAASMKDFDITELAGEIVKRI